MMASMQTNISRIFFRGCRRLNAEHFAEINGIKVQDKLNVRFITSSVQRVEVEDKGKTLRVHWTDGHISNFNSMWLRFCCPCQKCRDYVSNMTRHHVEKIPMDMTIKANVEDQGISVLWEQENHEGIFDLGFLAEHCMSKQRLEEKRSRLKPSPSLSKTISQLSFEEVVADEKGLYKWLKIINEEGLCLLKQVPVEEHYSKNDANEFEDVTPLYHVMSGTAGGPGVSEGTCSQVRSTSFMSRIAPVMKTLYGEIYDVKHEEKPINIAYSNEALAFHMDLLMYESPPGIQFLHCIEFDPSVEGGETTFKDLYAVAEEFRRTYPEHFRILCRVPLTFERIHATRDNPVRMMQRKPMFSLNDYDEIVAINWHANIVGPLEAKEEDIGPFFNAYHQFGKCVADRKHVKEIRFQPGDLIAYNNRRMVHGRNSFQSKDQGRRHLQGGYLNMDEYKSKLMVLEKEFGNGEPIKRVFNNDWM